MGNVKTYFLVGSNHNPVAGDWCDRALGTLLVTYGSNFALLGEHGHFATIDSGHAPQVHFDSEFGLGQKRLVGRGGFGSKAERLQTRHHGRG